MKSIWVQISMWLLILTSACSTEEYRDVSGPDFLIVENVTYHKGQPYDGKGYEFHELWGAIFFGQFKNGLKEGEWNSYSEQGKVLDIITYKKGVETGPFLKSYENGAPMLRGTFLNGLEEGKWELFYENGQLISYSTFTNGKRIGKREEFNRDGSPWFTKHYVDGIEVSCEGDCD